MVYSPEFSHKLRGETKLVGEATQPGSTSRTLPLERLPQFGLFLFSFDF